MKADITIYESFKAWAKENTPSGTRLELSLDGLLTIEVCCNGQVPLTALMCSLDPGHKDDCWSQNKRVNFEPEVGGSIDYLVAQGLDTKPKLPFIEDYEHETRGAYVRVSVDPDELDESEIEKIRKVLDALGLLED